MMNEQIKEFMKQAGTDTSGKWMSIDNAEKFAELIVRECADAADKYVRNGDIDIAKIIIRHFGVEE
jgi:hypothetical protein